MTLDPLIPVGDGHTTLSEEDRRGLIPTHIASRGDLYEAEQRNIATALLRRPPSVAQLLDDHYLRGLHRAMFGDVWRWAGRYRTTEKNLGWEVHRLTEGVHNAFEDAQAWLRYSTYPLQEVAVRLHYKLVAIHPWSNGNGRHARLMADILIRARNGDDLTWGAKSNLAAPGEMRDRYISAILRADGGDFGPLIDFARS